MFSSNSAKILFLFLLCGCQACGFWRGRTNATPTPTPYAAGELKSEIPFSTKEPEVYQTEIVTTDGNGFEEKTFAAKNGANRLLISDFQGKSEIAWLQLGASQSFLLARDQKIYAEEKYGTAAAISQSSDDFLISELLNQSGETTFETLGAENGLLKFRASSDATPNSETIIYFDEKIGLPVRQEFYGGETKKILTATELKNFSSQIDAKLFEVPKDYRRVSSKEFQEAIRRERAK